jgi:hypothetical protein
MALAPDPKKNHLLAALPAAACNAGCRNWSGGDRWATCCTSRGAREPRVLSNHAIVSLLYVMQKTARRPKSLSWVTEGIVGISLLMGGESTPSRAVVQSGGQGLRLSARTAKEFELAGLSCTCFCATPRR